MRDIASAYYHSLHPSGTPPLLPTPLPAPSTSRRADIPEADTPPRKRLLLTTPRPGCEIGESSASARQPGPTMTHIVDHSHVDVRSRESSEFHSGHHDAQTDRAAVRAEIKVLRRERLAYEQESIQTRQDLARSEAHCRALEARVTVLETELTGGIDLLFWLAILYRSFIADLLSICLLCLIDQGDAAAMAEAEAKQRLGMAG
ncbi:hypothetical protein Tco_0988933 [Tanacetum coccineum]|uniref:Uncharacterized protein n=1 Tax=Tanacetum coccineum TaxID=301880 RepID=A0ABQ5ESP1_9ASTR